MKRFGNTKILLTGVFAFVLIAAALALAFLLRTTGCFTAEESAQTAATDILQTKKTPVVLMYHSISDEAHQVTAENFEAQIKYLVNNGFTFLFPEEMQDSDTYEKPVIITFDDGFRNNYETAFPILKEYNVKATVFMITYNIGKDGYLTEDQIKALESSGLVRVEPHTLYHSDLTQITPEEARLQIETSNATIKEITGRDPKVFAYPYGDFNDDVKKIAAEYYDIAFAVNDGYKRDLMALYRAGVSNHMIEFKITVAAPGQIVSAAALSVFFIAAAVTGLIYVNAGKRFRKYGQKG